jgi:predicted RNA-binding Zn ribbon-like protein
VYDFESGNLSLDFANTKEWHGSNAPVEHLTGYLDLVEWGVQAGLVTPASAERLRQQAIENPDQVANEYQLAIQLREAIYRIFSNYFAGNPVPEANLIFLNDLACQAMSKLQLTLQGNTFQWQLPSDHQEANFILWSVAHHATKLLTSEQIARVRECEDDRGCGYLFIDQTKNHSRRWCSMESCGNRAKARRHYSRLQAG